MRVSGDLCAWQCALVALEAGGLRFVLCSRGLTRLFSFVVSPRACLHPLFSLAASHVRAILCFAGFMLQVRMGHIFIAFVLLLSASRWGMVMVAAEAYGSAPSGTNWILVVAVSLFFFASPPCCDRVYVIDLGRAVTSRTAMAPAARASTARSSMYVVEK